MILGPIAPNPKTTDKYVVYNLLSGHESLFFSIRYLDSSIQGGIIVSKP